MRIEQQNTGRYNKYPDKVEAQLIRIINRYFNQVVSSDDKIVESIIDEVIERVKTEIGTFNKAKLMTGRLEDITLNIPNVLIDKEISIPKERDINLIINDPQNISNIEVTMYGKTFYMGYGSYICKTDNDNSIEVITYHDKINKMKNILLINKSSNEVPLKIKVLD